MKSTYVEANWPTDRCPTCGNPRHPRILQARPIQPERAAAVAAAGHTVRSVAPTIVVAAVLIALFLMEGVIPMLAGLAVGR